MATKQRPIVREAHNLNRHYDEPKLQKINGRLMCFECIDGKHKHCPYSNCQCLCHESAKPERKQRDGGEQMIITEGGLPITARKE